MRDSPVVAMEPVTMETMRAASNASEHEVDSGVESTNSAESSVIYIRVSVPELNTQKCLQFNQDDTVWVAKQQILSTLGKDLKDGLNYGLYCPPINGRAGKFMDEERILKDYALPGPIGYLEFKYKRRIYKQLNINAQKLKKINAKGMQKQFLEVVRREDLDKLSKLLDKGLDPNFQDHDSGETPMALCAVMSRPRPMMMALVGGGALLDFRTRCGLTPMHVAAKHGNMEAVRALLDLGAGTNYRDGRGLTPLYYCVCHASSANSANLLLYNYAILGVVDSAGWTELHQACKAGRVQHVEQLLFYGADINQQNSGGNTPLHVCAVNNQEDCARVLLFRGADRTILNYANQSPAEVAIIASNSQLANLISTFSPDDVVLIQELPSYNEKRRTKAFLTVSSLSNLQRCRSNPQLYYNREMSSISPGSRLKLSSPSMQYSVSSSSQESPGQRMCHSSLGDQRYDSDSLRSMSVSSSGSYPGSAGELDLQNLRTQIRRSRQSGPRIVTLQKGITGFGFVLRGAKCSVNSRGESLEFEPTPDCPGLQYIERVEAGSVAESAGLLAGDFILEINGKSVVRASHERAVQLIRDAGGTVTLKLVTVRLSPLAEGVQTSASALSSSQSVSKPELQEWLDQHVSSNPERSGRHKSVTDAAMTLSRGRVAGRLSDTRGLHCYAETNLARYSSVPSLSTTDNGRLCGAISVLPSLKHLTISEEASESPEHPAEIRSRLPEVVYATPAKVLRFGNCTVQEDFNPPPLPPPPEFSEMSAATRCKVLPIATRGPHIYANVSQSISAAKLSTRLPVESSFRPGMNAQLSTEVGLGDVSNARHNLNTQVHCASNHQSFREQTSESEDRICVDQHDTLEHSPNFPLPPPPLTLSSPPVTDVSLLIPPPPLPPPPAPPLPENWQIQASLSKETNLQTRTPSAPPSVPNRTDSASKMPMPKQKSVDPPNTSHSSAIFEAVAQRRKFVDTADMDCIAESIEQRIQRTRPMRRVIYKANQPRESIRAEIGPVRLSSGSSCQGDPADNCSPQRKNVEETVTSSSSVSSENLSGDFLAMAEKARLEYLRRRTSLIGIESHATGSGSTVAKNEPFHVVGPQTKLKPKENGCSGLECLGGPERPALGDFAEVIAQKALQRRRCTVACGDSLSDFAAVSSDSAQQSSKEKTDLPAQRVQSSPALASSSVNAQVQSNHCSKLRSLRQEVPSLERLHTYDKAPIVGGGNSTSAENVSDDNALASFTGHFNMLCFENYVVPPPPDFDECSPLSCEQSYADLKTPMNSLLSSDILAVVPPPPLGFDDDVQDGTQTLDFHLRPVHSWSVGEVGDWLDIIEMSEHRAAFEQCRVDGMRLTQLGRAELIELGVTQVGQRMNLERAIKRAIMSLH